MSNEIVPGRIWIVEGRCGEYSDRSEWAVVWCETEAEANEVAQRCREEDGSLDEDEREEARPGSDVVANKIKTDPNYRTDYRGTTYGVYWLDRAVKP